MPVAAPAPSVTGARTGKINLRPLRYPSHASTPRDERAASAPFWNAAVLTVSKRAKRRLPVQPVRTAQRKVSKEYLRTKMPLLDKKWLSRNGCHRPDGH